MGRTIKRWDLTQKQKDKIWDDLTVGYTLLEVNKRNNVTHPTIDFVVKERMRINRHRKNEQTKDII